MQQASQGFAYTLAQLPWRVFATLTFKNPLPIERRRFRLAWGHFHRVSDALRVPYKQLLIALRSEHGEVGDRPHFHYLLGGFEFTNAHSLCSWLAYDWKVASVGAYAEIRPYNSALAGADYIEGCLGGANLYEVGKFNRSDRLELSASVHWFVSNRLRCGKQHKACQGSRKNMGDAESPTVARAAENPALSQGLSPVAH